MSKQVRLRRGTTAQHSSFTGAQGEVTVDTDKKVVVVHDGSTSGGVPMFPSTGGNISGNITVEGDLAVHNGNTRTTHKYQTTSGISSTNTWATLVDLATLQTGGGFFAARARVYGFENGNANTSYCEYYILYSSSGWSIGAIGTKQALGTGYGNMVVRISGSNLQCQNSDGSPGAGTCYVSLDIFEPV